MEKYIPKEPLVAEIKRLRSKVDLSTRHGEGLADAYHAVSKILDTLEVKENKLPSPRFPHLNNIVDKVFGTGNLESLEYEEAEQLVLLAKEELLKDLEMKEVDLNDEIEKCLKKHSMLAVGKKDFTEIAKHFFELGLKAQKGE